MEAAKRISGTSFELSLHRYTVLVSLGIGILKAIFGQSEKYRRGRRMSITPVSGLKMREGGCEKGLLDPCAQDVPNNGDTVGGLRCVKGEGECWLGDGAGRKRI